jgi:hypothetical protein
MSPSRSRRTVRVATSAGIACVALAGSAHAAVEEVVPGVTYERLQRPGQVVDIVRVTPGPLIAVNPVLTGGVVTRRGRLTDAMRVRLGAGAVVGVNGDYFNLRDAYPSGLLMTGGELVSEPEPTRSALLFPPNGVLAAAKVQLAGTWQAVDLTSPTPFPQRTVDAINRPSVPGDGTILYTPRYGAPTAVGDRVDVLVGLDPPGVVGVNRPVTGTVDAVIPGGGIGVGPGTVALSGAGLAAGQLLADLVPGRRVSLAFAVAGIPDGTLNGLGGGPELVRSGVPLSNAAEGFTSGQLDGRTARTGIGQAADGTILLVVAEGPRQGSAGVTAAEQAQLMASLGATTAIGMDSGGSAMMAVRDSLVTPWASERPISDAIIVSYAGVQLNPPAPFVSPNGDGVNDPARWAWRAALTGAVRVTLARPNGAAVTTLYRGPLGPSGRRILLGASTPKVKDGRYRVIARFTPSDGSMRTMQSRPLIVDRTVGFLRLRKVGKAPRTMLSIGFRLSKAARVTIVARDAHGRDVTLILRDRLMRAGQRTVIWNLRAAGRPLEPGIYTVSVGIRSRFAAPALFDRVRVTAPKPAAATASR